MGIEPAGAGDERFVGVPGMSGLGRVLAEDLDLRLGVRVDAVSRDASGPEQRPWRLMDDAGSDLGGFDRVLIAAPAPQAIPLLAAAPALAEQAAEARYAPCWTLLLGFAEPLELAWDGLFVNSGPLGWVARNSSKPGRQAVGGEVWVLNASPAWTARAAGRGPGGHRRRPGGGLLGYRGGVACTCLAAGPPLAVRPGRTDPGGRLPVG
jgi:renalase